MTRLEEIRDALVEGCRGRAWEVRAPFLLYFAWVLLGHLRDAEYSSWFGPLNFGVHELGHFVFAALGQFMGVLGGSLLQCLVPVAAMVMFLRQRDAFAIAVCFAWLSTNLFYVATYAADAWAMQLPIVSPGGGHAVHDWNFLLSELGWYEADRPIAFLLRAAALLSMLVALAGGGAALWVMRETGRHERRDA